MGTDEVACGQRWLGIDPGLNTTGYGVIQNTGSRLCLLEAGIIRTKRGQTTTKRLLDLHAGLTEVLRQWQPGHVSLEQLYSHYERPRTAILMGHARGVILLCAAQSGIEVESLEPTKVKKLLTGNGRASKLQVQLAVKIQLSLSATPEPADVADALAIALCGFHNSKIGRGVVGQKI